MGHAMKLYASPASPFVRKVRVLLREAGLDGKVDEKLVATTAVKSDMGLAGVNPLAKIPTLVTTDGKTLYDSRVICRYLDTLVEAEFYPEGRLWDTLVLEATADGLLDAAVLMVYERRVRPEEKVFDGWIEAQWDKAIRAVGAIEERWMEHLNGPVDMGHIAVGCALGYLDFRHGMRNWRLGHGRLDDWYASFSERAAMKDTMPE